MSRHNTIARIDCGGFTLVEVLVAVSILSVIVAVVYVTFDAVTNATYAARTTAEELRAHRFLAHNLAVNLSTVYADPELMNEKFAFIGEDENGSYGPMDHLEFCSSAALVGGMAMPGMLKRVQYAESESSDGGETLGLLGGDEDARGRLEVTESLLADASWSYDDEDLGESSLDLDDFDYDSPRFPLPVQTFDVTYFDGEEWQEEWDSVAMAQLPWGVRIRANFVRPEGVEDSPSSNLDDGADFDMYYPLPISCGVITTGDEWAELYGSTAAATEDGLTDDDDDDEDAGSTLNSNSSSSSSGSQTTQTGRHGSNFNTNQSGFTRIIPKKESR